MAYLMLKYGEENRYALMDISAEDLEMIEMALNACVDMEVFEPTGIDAAKAILDVLRRRHD